MYMDDKIKKYFRLEGLYIIKDANRTYNVDFLDEDGDNKFYIFRLCKNGRYKKISKDKIVDFKPVYYKKGGEGESYVLNTDIASLPSVSSYLSSEVSDNVSDRFFSLSSDDEER